MPHECKLSIVHYSLKRHWEPESDKLIIPSKTTLEFHCGFRRFFCQPVFSQEIMNSDKLKYCRFFRTDSKIIASMFGQITIG